MADEQDQGRAQRTCVAYRTLAERMTSIHISRFSELPRIELYLDQLLSLVDDELSFMCLPEEGPLVTGSMVNNYVKRHVVPAPVKHRYTRRHVCYVVCVCLFKRVLSIEQVTRLIRHVEEENLDLRHTYDELCAALECALAEQFAVGPDFVAPAVEPVIDHDTLGLYHIVCQGRCSRYDFAQAILKAAHMEDKLELHPIRAADAGSTPSYTVLDNLMLRLDNLPQPRPWKEALNEYINSLQ